MATRHSFSFVIWDLGCLVGKFEASLVEDSYFIYLPSEAFGIHISNQITSSMVMAAPGRGKRVLTKSGSCLPTHTALRRQRGTTGGGGPLPTSTAR